MIFLLLPFSAQAADSVSLSQLNDCNWQVNYRGRTYDLSPLTREALARPIETDIRYALQRVPEANAHLTAMSALLREARVHTIFASAFLSGFIVARILRSGKKNAADREDYDIASYATGGLFFTSTLFSWTSTKAAKRELVNAVEAFNENSPYKIEPASSGAPLPVAQ